MRRLLRFALFVAIGAFVLFLWGFHNARADPIVRRASIGVPGWPTGARPVKILMLSDVHLGNAVMDEARLTRIVAQINALGPDLDVIAGDLVAGYDPAEANAAAAALIKPLRGLRAPLGVVATLGNHDLATSPTVISAALKQAGITVLDNQAVQRGPLAIGGSGDDYIGHDDLRTTLGAMHGLHGARLMVTHSPDLSPRLPRDVSILLAGHTHCGQVVLPVVGALAVMALAHYRCGPIRDPGRVTIVGAGIGTSVLPIRFGAPPDMWLLTLGPAKPSPARSRR